LRRIELGGLVLIVSCSIFVCSLASPASPRHVGTPKGHSQAAGEPSVGANEGTERGGLSRDGWYPEATLLTPSNIATGGFGLISSVPVTGEVFAQPVMDGSDVIVATEENWIYGINQITGARNWAVQVGANVGAQPFDQVDPGVSSLKPWSCTNIAPYVGVTSTPVVDSATGVIYIVALEQLTDGDLGYFMHALNPENGAEEPNFPVKIHGTAQNDSEAAFVADDELQRPALTLIDGVIYVGFGSHCITPPYQGYIAGVAETGRQTTLWTDDTDGTANGGGIWQSGSGFVSDVAGQILVATGNTMIGTSPSGSVSGNSPPTTGSLGESDIRLITQKSGSLRATDFFTPDNALALDEHDLDVGSGAPVLLPSEFGTTSVPNLLVQDGKGGEVYLLNAKSLGGVSPGNAGALAEQGPDGGSLATPGVWPGDGGYVYIPTVNSGGAALGSGSEGSFNVLQVTDPPTGSTSFGLNVVATGPKDVGFGTSSPIVTSSGTTSSSAVVWIVDFQDGGGPDADLQAYNAVPNESAGSALGTLTLIGQWPVTNASAFAEPGVGDNRLFVPTSNDRILIYGLSTSPVIVGQNANFSTTTIGRTKSLSVHFIAKSSFTLSEMLNTCGVCTRTSQFSAAVTSPASENGKVTVSQGQTVTVDVTFRPRGSPGYRSDVLRIVSATSESDVTLRGIAMSRKPWVTPSTYRPTIPNFVVGQHRKVSSSVTFTNHGAKRAVIVGIKSAGGHFAITGIPKIGEALAPGSSFTARISFSSHFPGTFTRTIDIKTDSFPAVANSSVTLTATAIRKPVLSVNPRLRVLDFGSAGSPVAVGTPLFRVVTLTNRGTSAIQLSSVSTSGPFILAEQQMDGETLKPGLSTSIHLLYVPIAAGTAAGTLHIDPSGLAPMTVQLRGHSSGSGAAISAPGTSVWAYGGDASMSGSTLLLTTNGQYLAGSAFALVPMSDGKFVANFTATAQGGTSGDGEALVLADASDVESVTSTAPVGGTGDQVGFGGIAGVAVVIGEEDDPGAPGHQWVGVANGIDSATGGLNFAFSPTELAVSTLDTPNDVTVALEDDKILVWVNGIEEINESETTPSSFLVGFSAGTGLSTDSHEISNVTLVGA
jgi:hypothetical protein